eukprot:CAMPEP_0182586926 /NCGR_PEP_ID=MMETSP1324-20130603/63852_1 /TAXON_ID=236786 /ORGANISM="Florenciella sp., Strain RCC1587" /LENGTH=179 /DNA_ID=CAMNT_0024803879 /DNA_START=46 /DNA_END=581 /DNA_ORIENTATION=-
MTAGRGSTGQKSVRFSSSTSGMPSLSVGAVNLKSTYQGWRGGGYEYETDPDDAHESKYTSGRDHRFERGSSRLSRSREDDWHRDPNRREDRRDNRWADYDRRGSDYGRNNDRDHTRGYDREKPRDDPYSDSQNRDHRPIESARKSGYAEGERVLSQYKGRGKKYPGRIRHVNRDGTYDV